MQVKKNDSAQGNLDVLQGLLRDYQEKKAPIEVSYRSLMPSIKGGERLTHYIHQYPAKLLPQIPAFFLNNNFFCEEGGVVLDPFSGSGTVPLETVVSGRQALICDANPLARLISQVKTTPIDPFPLMTKKEEILSECRAFSGSVSTPNVVNLNYWFGEKVIKQLSILREVVFSLNYPEKEFFLVCFSSVVRRVALTDKRLSVPVKIKNNEEIESINNSDVFNVFKEISEKNIGRMGRLWQEIRDSSCKVASTDARRLVRQETDICGQVDEESVDAIITSPPYAGAQKYVRASGLSLGWLGFAGQNELRPIEKKTVGREHLTMEDREGDFWVGIKGADDVLSKVFSINKERAFIASVYLREMRQILKESVRCLKPGGGFLLVAGDNTICGENFETSKYLKSLCIEAGLEVQLETVDRIVSRGLMTKRNKTAGIIAKEHVLWMRKI